MELVHPGQVFLLASAANTAWGRTELGAAMTKDNRWADAQRLEGWAGEVRVNLIRLAALVVFYGHHLLNVYFFQDESARGAYHAAVTALVLAWSAEVVGLYFSLARRWVPPVLKYAATAWDTLMITALLVLGRDPGSMLAVLYFLVIAAAVLRLSLPLVYAATLGTMAAYAFFLGYLKFWLDLPAPQRLAPPQQVIFLLALGAAGILAGQMVRQARRLVQGYPVSVADEEK
jgi:hypothetical protein